MALELSLWLDRSSLEPGAELERARCSLAVELAATGAPAECARQASRTVLALDVSESMKGEPLAQVMHSVDRILDAIEAGEAPGRPPSELGIVAFSETAAPLVEPVRVDAAGKRLVRSKVARLFAEGGTNIEAGLDASAVMLDGTPPSMRRGVVLLSDGAPNVGAHTAEALRDVVRRHRPGISFVALGFGPDHSEDVLSSIGDVGGGGYEVIADPAACARSFARALGVQGDVVASGIELVVAPGDGVELVRFVGREDTRYAREGVIVSLADMVNGGRRVVVAELSVRPPVNEHFVADVVQVTVRWRSPFPPGGHAVTRSAELEVVAGAPRLVADASRRILLARAEEARTSARVLADQGQFGGAAAGLRAVLRQIEQLEGFVAGDGSPLAEAYQLLLDEVETFARRPSLEAYAAFRKAQVSSPLAVSVPSAARSRGPVSQTLIAQVAGDCPEAWLVGSSVRHRLREECLIGRANAADLRLVDDGVAHRHAEVFADAGYYWIADLGSMQPSYLNGAKLARAPHKLQAGDVIRLGSAELRYDEGPRETRKGARS